MHEIYRQLLVPGQPPGPWVAVGQTCFPDLVPGAARGPSMAQIIDAFHRTPWAVATIAIQPPGGRTLIGLDTYYQLIWSAAGYEPGEIDHLDPATMAGFQVDIRPRLQALTWQFGDDVTFGPTTDLGGPYPDGAIRHAYTARGSFPVSVAVTWAGDYRINGGPWIAINDTVTVTSPPVLLQVLEARAELINPPG